MSKAQKAANSYKRNYRQEVGVELPGTGGEQSYALADTKGEGGPKMFIEKS